MENHKYKLVKAEPSFPSIDLLMDEANPESPVFGLFGPSIYSNNRKEMEKTYTHSADYPQISFRPATSSESISAVAYDIKDAKEKILDPRWLQLGYIVRTSEGVFANPLDEQANPITDEKTLKSLLNGAEKVNGIYLLLNGFGFAPYGTFKQGEQSSEDFAQGGLARLLEHTNEKTAKNLKEISSPKLYKLGVNVWGFDEVKEPTLRVASLGSNRDSDCGRLGVDGYVWDGDYYGYAFGVVDSEAGDARKNK